MTDLTETPAPDTTGNIARKIGRHPPHVQAGITAYRAALNERKDWHVAVVAAIEAAISAREEMTRG